MLDSIDHMIMMTSKLLKNSVFGVKKSRFCHFYATFFFKMHRITKHYLICKPLVVYQFHCIALYHSEMRIM